MNFNDLVTLDNMNPSDHPLLQGKEIPEQIRELLNSFFQTPPPEEAYQRWYESYNPYLEGSPKDLVEKGKGILVRDFLWRGVIGRPG